MKKTMLLLLASMSLTGCNSEPSDADISKAMQSFMSEMHGTLNSSKKLACKDIESDGSYLCSVEFDAKLPIVGHRESTLELKFIKSDDSWKAMAPSK
ncbi:MULTISPECIES: hypothetical protein [Enterobacteriaceae]|uniref:hypothetical protein n=1 Tax=Enterobacteriaceae TaxID=543 RepID=UPI000BEA059C|nr:MULTISPECIES: hypothetical protein [Enterobacteriaceae]WOZ92140.1 hypothetical protein QDV90_22075 [Klebsiella pneumoniae]EFA3910677.1 hypothetical protein [Escherichia coli]EFH7301165.1 hypothetical protein [Escherichia coli]EFN4960118.1 hypothetical protein [Escherichia coli]EIN4962238.1 hypothetical protein [Escherichia coli]